MSVRLAATRLLGLAALASLVLLPVAARGVENDSEGVTLTVEITPLPCVGACAGPLPATGGEFMPTVVWMAVAVIALGSAAYWYHWRSTRPVTSGREAVTQTPYDGVTGHSRAPGATVGRHHADSATGGDRSAEGEGERHV